RRPTTWRPCVAARDIGRHSWMRQGVGQRLPVEAAEGLRVFLPTPRQKRQDLVRLREAGVDVAIDDAGSAWPRHARLRLGLGLAILGGDGHGVSIPRAGRCRPVYSSIPIPPSIDTMFETRRARVELPVKGAAKGRRTTANTSPARSHGGCGAR